MDLTPRDMAKFGLLYLRTGKWEDKQIVPAQWVETSAKRLSEWYPNAIQVNTPVHASWLNQIEIYFSVVQRKVLTPSDFKDLDEVERHLMQFQLFYEKIAKPFKWKFTKDDLKRVLAKISLYDQKHKHAT